ncbi:hypothetical protein Dsin_016455 [Dipteronia sinensis]|uniref:Uncharacterized protein n=1 Tax=Dipteronia sinensis TaxID=43782 RepID=A0AAE0AD92_9ROSI|nr:hypothetical protein Dsin_016455 [Dipteronia sinensis]
MLYYVDASYFATEEVIRRSNAQEKNEIEYLRGNQKNAKGSWPCIVEATCVENDEHCCRDGGEFYMYWVSLM